MASRSPAMRRELTFMNRSAAALRRLSKGSVALRQYLRQSVPKLARRYNVGASAGPLARIRQAATDSRSGTTVSRMEALKEFRTTALLNATSTVSMTGIPTYADNAAAIAGGIAVGTVYHTATGEVRIRV